MMSNHLQNCNTIKHKKNKKTTELPIQGRTCGST